MRAFVALACLLLVAGCLGKDSAPDTRTVMASEGKASMGWSYDGAGLQAATASLDGLFVDSANTGNVNISFELADSRWSVVFDKFAQAADKPFMDGGIEFDLDEHGDTGVADKSIPKIHALVAAWGQASVSRDGVPVTLDAWSAHIMVSEDTVRGVDGKITKTDGATPYDPATPADARRIEGDPQVLFWIKHPQGETFSRAPESITASVSCQGPQCGSSVEIAIPKGASMLDLNVTFSGPASPVSVPVGPVGQGRLTILDANGTELAGIDIATSPAGNGSTAIGSIALEGAPLPLTMTLAGDGAFTATATGMARFQNIPFIVLTWDDITVD
jgi:hypothetical protein